MYKIKAIERKCSFITFYFGRLINVYRNQELVYTFSSCIYYDSYSLGEYIFINPQYYCNELVYYAKQQHTFSNPDTYI